MFDLTLLSVRGHYKASYKTAKEPGVWPWQSESRAGERNDKTGLSQYQIL